MTPASFIPFVLSLVGIAALTMLGSLFHFGTTPVDAQAPVRVISLADVTLGGAVTQIVPANANRRTLSCTNNDAAASARWGDQAITTTRGQRIASGSTATIAATAAIFMIAESGAPIVSCTQETK